MSFRALERACYAVQLEQRGDWVGAARMWRKAAKIRRRGKSLIAWAKYQEYLANAARCEERARASN